MTRYHGFRKILSLYMLFNIFAFVTLYLYKNEYDKSALIYGGILAGILCITSILIIINQLGDEYLFIIVSMQISIGSVILFRISTDKIAKQIIW
ncbi:MAG: hypothetical protein ABF289_04630, partial [Clostridiales bacterium]